MAKEELKKCKECGQEFYEDSLYSTDSYSRVGVCGECEDSDKKIIKFIGWENLKKQRF